MLSLEAPFPEVGSYALFVDADLPLERQQAELVRILARAPGGGDVLLAFPLRQDASGNKRVDGACLIDGTPLTGDEDRELSDLARHLADRDRLTPKMKAQKARHDALRARSMWAAPLSRLLARHAASQGRAAA